MSLLLKNGWIKLAKVVFVKFVIYLSWIIIMHDVSFSHKHLLTHTHARTHTRTHALTTHTHTHARTHTRTHTVPARARSKMLITRIRTYKKTRSYLYTYIVFSKVLFG